MAYILAVDDDPQILRLVAEILKREGHTVITAHNAFRALEALNHREPDLVLTDIQMLDLDGHALCRAVRQYHPKLPIVALTAESVAPSQDGFDAVVPKPFRIADLIGTIHPLLIRKRPCNPTDPIHREEPA